MVATHATAGLQRSIRVLSKPRMICCRAKSEKLRERRTLPIAVQIVSWSQPLPAGQCSKGTPHDDAKKSGRVPASTGLREAQLEELAFQLLLATGERAPDAASAAAVQDTVRRALQASTAQRQPAYPSAPSDLHGKPTLRVAQAILQTAGMRTAPYRFTSAHRLSPRAQSPHYWLVWRIALHADVYSARLLPKMDSHTAQDVGIVRRYHRSALASWRPPWRPPPRRRPQTVLSCRPARQRQSGTQRPWRLRYGS